MNTRTAATPASLQKTQLPTALFALALGAFLVWGAGFASADALHDAAHDVRHSLGMPCH